MDILVECPSCDHRFRVDGSCLGVRSACPACHGELTVRGERVARHDVFISYATEDTDAAVMLCDALESATIPCWMAPRDIAPGQFWPTEVARAVSASQVLILVYSRHSNASRQVLNEIVRAVDKDVTVIPLRIDETPMSLDMEYFLSARHWLDAIGPHREKQFERLAVRVGTLLDEKGIARRITLETTQHETESESVGEPVQPNSEALAHGETTEADGGVTETLTEAGVEQDRLLIDVGSVNERRCRCGVVVAPAHTYCVYCGLEFTGNVRCNTCHVPNDAHYHYCIACGAALGSR